MSDVNNSAEVQVVCLTYWAYSRVRVYFLWLQDREGRERTVDSKAHSRLCGVVGPSWPVRVVF